MTISRGKLEIERKKQIKRLPLTKNCLILSILRDKDFSPQAMKDVLSFLPPKEKRVLQKKEIREIIEDRSVMMKRKILKKPESKEMIQKNKKMMSDASMILKNPNSIM